MKQLCERYKLSTAQFEAWFKKNQGEKLIADNMKLLSSVHEEIFNQLKCTHPGFGVAMPEKLTQKLYLMIYAKIFATLRFDFYQALSKHAKEAGIPVEKVDKEKFVDIWRTFWENFEGIRTEIFNLLMGTDDSPAKWTQQDAKRIMQQAYVTFARPTEDELKLK